ncbi:MAG TPA: aldolase/citrate lyase family protein [Mycobacteriales bacterium]|jgi:citrate lyase beta subunit|nr:aldolase/citrate lyase family protein [Mycobacteriales bacterium]
MSLDASVYARLDAALADVDVQLAADYPGERGDRQPVHTVYVPADRFTATLPGEWGTLAVAALDALLPDAPALAELLDVETSLAAEVLPRVRTKLSTEPIEDLRVDFEDGYGRRPDAEEDEAARLAAGALAAATLAYCGIRFKSLEPATRRRGIHTLDLFLDGLLAAGPLRNGFVVTLPKVTHVGQVRAFTQLCSALEESHSLSPGMLRFEIQIETPQAILAADGTAAVARMVHSGDGRITGLHFGTYDYSAACGVASPYQSLDHAVADHAKAVMQLAASGTGVRLSDGSINVLPVGSATQIRAAWQLHARLVRRSLERAYYQGWDLHPLQLVTRYAATYAFYREGMPDACDRLRTYFERAESGVLDEPATVKGMAALLTRGLQCGALDSAEVAERSGLAISELEALHRRQLR